jgi:hypothetical protein
MNTLSFRIDIQGPDQSECIYVVPVLLVDDEPVADFTVFGLDLNELVKSKRVDGEHFIITCWCGAPDCVRIDQGIGVQHRKAVIQWKTSYPLQSAVLSFDAVSYGQAIDELLELLPQRWSEVIAEFNNVHLVPYGCDLYVSSSPSQG